MEVCKSVRNGGNIKNPSVCWPQDRWLEQWEAVGLLNYQGKQCVSGLSGATVSALIE